MRKLSYTILVLFAGLGLFSPVFALTVSPVKIDITGDPGTTVHGEIELFNEQDSNKTFYSSFENFETNGESGAPSFVGAKDGLATWLQTDTQVVLNSNQRTKVPFSITIPYGAEAGGYFAAIFFGSQPPGKQESSQLAIGGKLGILVFLKVSGKVEEGGGLLDFTTKNNQIFFDALPINFYYRVNNTGGDRVIPQGLLEVKNLGFLNSFSGKANLKDGSVLPRSIRKFEVGWVNDQALSEKEKSELGFFGKAFLELKAFNFGWYTANLNIFWGENNSKSFSSRLSFFIIPWHLLMIVGVFLLVVLGFGFFGLKRYNRWIIAKATKSRRKRKIDE